MHPKRNELDLNSKNVCLNINKDNCNNNKKDKNKRRLFNKIFITCFIQDKIKKNSF
jgi:hypothetical protein